jgi:hypothetical protein
MGLMLLLQLKFSIYSNHLYRKRYIKYLIKLIPNKNKNLTKLQCFAEYAFKLPEPILCLAERASQTDLAH